MRKRPALLNHDFTIFSDYYPDYYGYYPTIPKSDRGCIGLNCSDQFSICIHGYNLLTL